MEVVAEVVADSLAGLERSSKSGYIPKTTGQKTRSDFSLIQPYSCVISSDLCPKSIGCFLDGLYTGVFEVPSPETHLVLKSLSLPTFQIFHASRMGEAIAFISLTAAIPQLVKYTIEALGEMSRFSKSIRTRSQALQEWEDRLNLYLSLTIELEIQHLSSDKLTRDTITRLKDQIQGTASLIRKLSIAKGDQKFVRLKKKMKFIQAKKDLVRQLLTIYQLNTGLHQRSSL